MSLLVRMLREEWRRHAELFGPKRFAAFPIGLAAVAATTVWFLLLGDATIDDVGVGLHGLVALFGLHVGTVAFVGRDALQNLLGDVTLLVFSARTLPVRRSRLLGTFLVKDLLIYTIWYVAPLIVAVAPFWIGAGNAPATLALLWLTTAASFMLGVTLSLLFAAVYTRGRIALVGTAVVAAFGIGWLEDPLVLTPLALYTDPSLATALAGLGPILVFGAIGLALFRPTALSTHRTADEQFRTLRDRIPGDERGLVTWSIFDVLRSSGSVWKLVFSAGVVFAVCAFLVAEVESLLGVRPATGLAFGTLLGIGSFTAYSWLTQFDDPETYLLYPLSVSDVVRAKLVAFLLCSIPISLGYLAVAVWLFDATALLAGVAVLVLTTVYVFGLTGHVAGLSPNQLLFDTPRFLRYGIGLMIVAVPLLVAAMAYEQWPTEAVAGSMTLSAVAAVVGIALYRRAGPAWDRRVRDVE